MTDKQQQARNAFILAAVSATAYLGVYFARSILSAVSPQMTEEGVIGNEGLGRFSSVFFIVYALGQLVNGFLGERIRAKYMIAAGICGAGICCLLFGRCIGLPLLATVIYGAMALCLSMVYGPIVKLVAENMNEVHAVRASTAYSFSSHFGATVAGLAAAALPWRNVFLLCAAVMLAMGLGCLALFTVFEKKRLIGPPAPREKESLAGGVKRLLDREILRFTCISIITGIVRTSVIFWMPTYFSEHLGFSARASAELFTAGTLIISVSSFAAVFLYEKLGRKRDPALLLSFALSAGFFLLMLTGGSPFLNAACMIAAVFCGNMASSVQWSVYCPSLNDTGLVSTATGFLDFASYIGAAVSSRLFSTAIESLGWNRLMLIWAGIMALGIGFSFSDEPRV